MKHCGMCSKESKYNGVGESEEEEKKHMRKNKNKHQIGFNCYLSSVQAQRRLKLRLSPIIKLMTYVYILQKFTIVLCIMTNRKHRNNIETTTYCYIKNMHSYPYSVEFFGGF